MLFRWWEQSSAITTTGQADNASQAGKDVIPVQGYNNINIGGDARVIVGNAYRHEDPFIQSPDARMTKHKAQQNDRPKRRDSKGLQIEQLVAVLNDYEKVSRNIRSARLHTLGGRTRYWSRSIGARHAIFHQSLHDILMPFGGSETTQQMLTNTEHLNWSSDAFRSYLETRLGSKVHDLTQTLEDISLNLDAIHEAWSSIEANKSEPTIAQHDQASPATPDHNMDLQLLVSGMECLTQNTNHLRTIVQQSVFQQKTISASCPSSQARSKVSRYSRVQAAAENLYRALGMACSKHLKHQIRLMLQAVADNPSHVLFRLILAQPETCVATDCQPLLKLAIESQLTGVVSQTRDFTRSSCSGFSMVSRKRSALDDDGGLTPVHPVGTAVKKAHSYDTERLGSEESFPATHKPGTHDASTRVSQKRKKTVCFADDNSLMDATSYSSTDMLPNFCTKGNLCTHVSSIQIQEIEEDRALGYLASKGCAKHLIYLEVHDDTVDAKPTPHLSCNPATLRSLFKGNGLSQSEIASLSKQLAIATLQYHATPWLEAWDGDHVLINDRSLTQDTSSFGSSTFESYIDVSIHNPQQSTATPIASRSKTLIPNWTLFRLGVMLLELAYQKPLREMQEPDDHYPNEYDTDYFTARRLSDNVSKKMGLRFAKVVRKCIACNFGHGEDLSTTDLQACYHEDVIQELDAIERGLKQMGL